MEVFGIIGMSFGVFGFLGWIQSQANTTELAALKNELRESGVLKDISDPARKE
jgi:hypothetical protein